MKHLSLISMLFFIASLNAALGFEVTHDLQNTRGYQFDDEASMNDIRKLATGVFLGRLSFHSKKSCIKPPQSPPNQLLKRIYEEKDSMRLFAQAGNWADYIHHVDLNGDGICDWLREGAHPHRLDQGGRANSNEFLFLGTKTGWRYSTQTRKGRFLEQESRKNPSSPYYGNGFSGFLAPFVAFVYEETNPKPFIVVQTTSLWPNPYPIVSLFRTFRWNDEIDNFNDALLEQHAIILLFLQKEFCSKDSLKIILGRNVQVFTDSIKQDTTLPTLCGGGSVQPK